MQRLIKPLLNTNGCLQETDFKDAFSIIHQNLLNSKENDTLVMSSGDYSNETLYQLQKLARTALNTNSLSAFSYYNRGTDFFADKNDIVPFAELFLSDIFFCAFDENSQAETLKAIFEILKKCPDTPKYWFNNNNSLKINDFSTFFRCINHYILENNLEKGIYIQGLGKNYQKYKEEILSEDLQKNINSIDLKIFDIQYFTDLLLKYEAPVFIVWEPLLSQQAYHELENLCMLIGIQSKPSSGFLCIKPDVNSQGLYDMGFFTNLAPGGTPLDTTTAQDMQKVYQHSVCTLQVDIADKINNASFENVLLWNASMKEISQDIENQVDKSKFSVLHSAFLPENANKYSLILPANLPEEFSGTYTDSARVPHNYNFDSNILEYNNLQQISEIAKCFGISLSSDKDDIFLEYISFMRAGCDSAKRHFFK